MNPFLNFILNFVTLSDNDRNLLENELTYKIFKTGERILQEGSICKNILFIVSGIARSFFINQEGQDLTWNFHFNDNESKFENYFLVDYNSFLTQTPTFLSFQALEDIEVVMLSYDSIQKLTSNSHILEKVASKMSETAYQNVHKRAFILLTLNAKERYMQILKEEPYLLNKFQHYLIASYIGVAPESLSRLRKEITKSKK
jgi:CRP-like cAMP-binding protein